MNIDQQKIQSTFEMKIQIYSLLAVALLIVTGKLSLPGNNCSVQFSYEASTGFSYLLFWNI